VPATRLRLYPRETHVAEKLHAYTLPRRRENSRVRDLPTSPFSRRRDRSPRSSSAPPWRPRLRFVARILSRRWSPLRPRAGSSRTRRSRPRIVSSGPPCRWSSEPSGSSSTRCLHRHLLRVLGHLRHGRGTRLVLEDSKGV
jgi:hypothetical protein